MKKIIAAILALALVGTGAYFTFFDKSDDEKIADRLEAIETAYANGDMDAILDCMDTKSRNAYKGLGSLGSMIGGSVGPFSFNLGGSSISSLFSVTVAVEDVSIKFTIKNIEYTDKTHATVTADLWESENYLYDETTQEVTFEMVKEKNDWYLSDF